ncbi:hypothetical protein GIB67_042856 [Kingdonia uniflora]|uniref:Fungal lipase-type domain-containing protein n=1 Tax=Kingdonia uniflora TaxID=39325 RepID=A0A7J7NS84_9MAGN|nr:hypothetical protein GIB67_042856 [Kingdonia uniflora]
MASTSFTLKPNACLISFSRNARLPKSMGTCSFGHITTLPKSMCINTSTNIWVVHAVETCLAKMWREIQGFNNWDDLIEPLHPLLREEIIRYGEFVTACYKVLDFNPTSSRYLNTKYGKRNMLRRVGMEGCGYEVTKYIYATPNIKILNQADTCTSRWVGFVAVSTDEEVKRIGRRDVVVTFRGTVTAPEWVANFMSSLTPAMLDPNRNVHNVMVESGFLSMYTSCDSTSKFNVGSCRDQLISEISRLVNMFKGEEMSITLVGHSMGSSIALLFAYDIAELGLNIVDMRKGRSLQVTVYSFGGPRVGNTQFKERCEELGIKVLRIVNVKDPVTKLPAGLYSWSCYVHVGVELALDFFKMENPADVHDIETYIKYTRCFGSACDRSDWADFLDNVGQTAKNIRNLVQSLRKNMFLR